MDTNVVQLPERQSRRNVVRRAPARVVDISEAITARAEIAYERRVIEIADQIKGLLDEAEELKVRRPAKWIPAQIAQ